MTRRIEPQDLFIVVGRDVVLRTDHAILVVYHGNEFFGLDNLTNKVYKTTDLIDFKPKMTVNEIGLWIHGYKV